MGRALHPPRMRRHPEAVGIRPPPTGSWPRRGHDRRAAATGALLRVRSNPDSAAAALQPRRADSTEVIGTALVHKAAGLDTGGSPPYWAARRPPSAAGCVAPAARVISPGSGGAQELIRLDADAFNQLASTGNLLRDTLTVGRRGWWARGGWASRPVWTLIGLYTGGRLLAPPG